DFVRMEIVAALQHKIRVIPVLVGGARMPGRHDLPEALAPLGRRNAIELSETRFHADVNRLIAAIERSFAVAEKEAELSPTPAAPPPEPAAVRPPEPESKDFPEPSGFTKPVKSTQTTPAARLPEPEPKVLREPSESTKPGEAKEPKEVDGDAISEAAPVSLGETTKQFPTEAAA